MNELRLPNEPHDSLAHGLARYSRPEKKRHRGFVYLDDDAVINSLSAIEAGKIDEVVAKIVSAKEGTLSGGVGSPIVKAGGERTTSSSFEEAITRTRTRFSFFEIWYSLLTSEKSIGRFEGWDDYILADVEPGDTVELRAEVRMQPAQIMFRLFLWYSEQSKKPGSLFRLSGEEQKAMKESVQALTTLLGGEERMHSVFAEAHPTGSRGPRVILELSTEWAITPLGRMSGIYTIIGQVDEILNEGETYPAIRLTGEVPVTDLEREALKEAMEGFAEPAEEFGLEVGEDAVAIPGPALILRPIGIFR